MLFFAGLGKLRNAHGTYVEGDYLAAFFEAMHVPTRLGVAAHTALAKAPAARRALGSFGVFFEVVLPWFLFRPQPGAACVGVLRVGGPRCPAGEARVPPRKVHRTAGGAYPN